MDSSTFRAEELAFSGAMSLQLTIVKPDQKCYNYMV